MTEKQAWRYIAEAYYTPEEKRDWDQAFVTQFGICRAITTLYCIHRIEVETAKRMKIIVGDELKAMFSPAYFYFYCRKGDLLRADWCYWQSLLNKDER